MDEMPRFGLGTYQNEDHEQCAESVRTALDVGYRNVDTAQMYDNEAAVGDGIAQADVDRSELFLASKLDTDNCAHDDVLETTEESTERLDVDTIDLMYVHWPMDTYDPEGTLSALDELREEGAIEHVGLSNFTPDQLDEANDHLDAPIFAHQVEMHPLLQQEELQEYAVEDDHLLVAYCPIARGKVDEVEEMQEVAEKHDATPVQVSIAWLLAKENVVAIPKATGEEHIRENYEAQDLDLDDEDIERIDGIEREERLVDFDEAPWNQD
ncbi:aldo/keto reductase [Halomarina salina]|uniref:Aldo/keto reductase n=1 Tax=Halomarina salina TaxID=1872699 RepID=A0ABD5RI73_9EURY|nr:aldo/keto reductase [Halomarina salina]